jgi:crotonobetainyl-CoA:carnitine CoA-transferase CaiB-like acyl-CoA transferase
VNNIDDTYQEIAATMATRTTEEWLEVFGETSVPTIIVNTLEGLTTDPHLEAVDFWQLIEHPTEGTLRMASFPVNFSASPAGIRNLAPRLGENSVEILREAGVTQERIDAMIESGTTIDAQSPRP